MTIAEVILLIGASYAAAGCVFAVIFVRYGIHHVDPAARSAPFMFRALVFPGLVAMWPVMLRKWRRVTQTESLHRAEPQEEGRSP
ncbi:MAG: hypothetical protein H7210_13600 [Pyrinomonadaceae bacterium]|nr:hypothetical protein [Phycisphaerales bacterium]